MSVSGIGQSRLPVAVGIQNVRFAESFNEKLAYGHFLQVFSLEI
jgi:hypothetical protein